jgi:hypothetical protein
MCTALLPPGGYPIAVKKYIISYHIIQHYCTQYEHHESRRLLNIAKTKFVIPYDQSELQPRTAVLSMNFKSIFQQPSLHSLSLNKAMVM